MRTGPRAHDCMRMKLESGMYITVEIHVLVFSSASQTAGESAASTVSAYECPISISLDVGVEDVPALVRVSDALAV